MDVSVIIPVKDDPRLFVCLDSIRAASGGRSVEVVVVDNGSSPGFACELKALEAAGLRVLAAEGTVYAARNRGAEAATGQALLFTDADCVVDPEWINAAVAGLASGADLAQGFSGSLKDSLLDRLIQERYLAPFKGMAPGTPVLCDTRNLAVRCEVFERIQFEEAFRRVGDTELGLRAETLGFRVAFVPGMKVDHEHEKALDVLIAKQICHGWGARRLMDEYPGLPWHGGHLTLSVKWLPRIRRLPLSYRAGLLAGIASIAGARLLDRLASRLPFRVSVLLLGALDKVAGLSGHLTYRRGAEEPSPSQLLKRRLARD